MAVEKQGTTAKLGKRGARARHISKAERDLIVPSNPQYVESARNAPDGQHARAFFVNPAVAMNAPAEAVAVPKMGVHWVNAKSPELQGMVGNPAGCKPFTATFIQGAWNGTFIFEEPMITRAYIMTEAFGHRFRGT